MAVTPVMTARQAAILRDTCQKNIQWERVRYLINWHRIASLAYQNLDRCAQDLVPKAFLHHLRQQRGQTGLNEMQLTAETIHTHRLLQREGIKVIFYKGPVLSVQLFGGIGWRLSKDIDLLVQPHQFELAAQTLLGTGYQIIEPDFELTPRQSRAYAWVKHHYTFVHPDRKVQVELHWRTNVHPHFPPVSFENQAFQRIKWVQLANTEIPTFSDHDHFIYLCTHGAYHGWYRLKWLVDIAAYVGGEIQMDWDLVIQEAQKWGLERPVYQAVDLTHELMGIAIPEEFHSADRPDKVRKKLMQTGIEIIKNPEDEINLKGRFRLISQTRYRMQLKIGWKTKIYDLVLAWLDPFDWRDYPLPDYLFPLYYVLRPIFWLKRYYLTQSASTSDAKQA